MIDITDKFLCYTGEEENYIKQCLKEKKLSGTSETVFKYEEKLKEYWGSEYAVATSSGTAALVTALHSLGVSSGDEVIISVLAPIMSALPVVQIGAIPVFADCQIDNFDFDYNDLEKLITNKTKAIIAVPIYGYSFDYDKLLGICRKYDISLIEDAAQAHGARYKNKLVGTIGDIGCFSTHDRKLLSTGEGGFILTNNVEIFNASKAYIQFDNMSGIEFGTNYKISSLQAAVGLSRISQIEWQVKCRNDNAQYFLSKIENCEYISNITVPTDSVQNYYSLVLIISDKLNANAVIKELYQKGIPSDVLKYKFVPLYIRDLFKKYKRNCENANKLSGNITTIPVHPGISRYELDYMSDIILDIVYDRRYIL